MSQKRSFHELMNQLDDVKEKITSQEYKRLCETLQQCRQQESTALYKVTFVYPSVTVVTMDGCCENINELHVGMSPPISIDLSLSSDQYDQMQEHVAGREGVPGERPPLKPHTPIYIGDRSMLSAEHTHLLRSLIEETRININCWNISVRNLTVLSIVKQ